MLCAVLVFAATAFGAVDPVATSILSVLLGIVGLLWLNDARKTGEFRYSANKLQLPILGLIVIGLIQLLPLGDPGAASLLAVPASSAISMDPYATRMFVVRLVLCFVFFAAALTFVNTERRLRYVALTIIIFGSVMAFFGILQRLAEPGAIYGMRPTPQAVPFGPFVNQHHFAAFMEMTAGLALGLLTGRSVGKDKRLFLILAAILMGTALVFTSSRGGMLSFLGVGAFLFASRSLPHKSRAGRENQTADHSPDSSRFAAIAGGVAILFLIFGLVLFLGGDQSLIRGIGLSGGTEDVTSGRSHFWQIGLKIFADHPVIGAGLDAFGVAFTEYDTRNGIFRVEQAHNDYLQTLTDAGILGFICIAAFIYLLFRRSLAVIGDLEQGFRRGAAIGALAGCFGVLIHSFFDFPLRTPSNAFFFLMLAAIATVPVTGKARSRHRH